MSDHYVSGTVARRTQMATILDSVGVEYRLTALLRVWIYRKMMIKSIF